MELTKDEINRLREWFGCMQDLTHRDYLERADYLLAEKIYKESGARVPNSIADRI